MPRHVLGGQRFVAPSDKVNVALIGAGGQGRTNARALFQEEDCQIIALADPARGVGPLGGTTTAASRAAARCRRRSNSTTPARRPITGARPTKISASCSRRRRRSTRSSSPRPITCMRTSSILAMKAGKHVYCEKPLTHNIREARLVARVAKETGVATQMGNQGRSGEGHRQTVEWLNDGAIGAVREVHAWSGNSRTARSPGQTGGPTVQPSGLNWDLWLGPRAARPYRGGYAPFVWRWIWDFGDGTMPDMGPTISIRPSTRWGSTRRAPWRRGPPTWIRRRAWEATWSPTSTARQGNRGPLTRVSGTTTASGRPTPLGVDPDDARQRLGDGENGLMVVGEKGILTCAGWSGMPRLLPLELHRDYKRPPKTLPRVAGHHADWLQACKGGTPACSNFEYGARLTEFILLGTLALRTGKVVRWDAAGMAATNAPEAQPFIEGIYRKGWELPL